jgi:putative endonuclease
MADSWWVYVLECEHGVLYTGVAKDVDARFAAHVDGKGAAFTRLNRPVRVLARTGVPDRSTALRLEYALKQLPRAKKLWWCAQGLEGFARATVSTVSDAIPGSA